MSKNTEVIQKILQSEFNEGKVEGLLLGLTTAERIFVNYCVNPKLASPYSHETLEEWARKELGEYEKQDRVARLIMNNDEYVDKWAPDRWRFMLGCLVTYLLIVELIELFR